MTPTADQNVVRSTTASGVAFAMLPPQDGAPAPTLLLLALAGAETLTTEPYCRVGRLLHARGWNVVSLDLPCHGADRRVGEPEELAGWATRTAAGEDFVAAFRKRAGEVLAHGVAAGMSDPRRIVAAGTSRGGYMAFQAAAGDPMIRAVAAFAPVTDLLALREFSGQEQNPLVRRLALANERESLADRAAWITIGNADARVGTDKAVAFARALAATSQARALACDVTLRVLPAPGHCSDPEWHEAAAEWVLQTVVSTVRVLPEPGSALSVPCTVYPPVNAEDRKNSGLVIHLHGAGGSHAFYNLMRPPYARLRRGLREAGYWVVVPDLGPSHWMNKRAVAILDAVTSSMVSSGDVDRDRVHLFGTSMGGGSALAYACQRSDRLRSVCAVFPMTDFEAWVVETPEYREKIIGAHGFDAVNPESALRTFSPLHRVADLGKLPVYLLHGEADSIVPVHHSRDFAAALRAIGGPVKYREVPGGGHDDGIAAGWQTDMLDFILDADARR